MTVLSISGTLAADDASTVAIQFNRDIRPILSDKCFACHGPDAAHREADLRLDVSESALLDRGGYAAIVSGDIDASELVARIVSEDESIHMPPADSGKELSDEEIHLLTRWIEEGAEYELHWSLAPLERPAVPEVDPQLLSSISESSADIDAFIVSRMVEQGLEPSPIADPVTLIRRLSFDLTGLPPSREDVERFVADPSDAEYQRLVYQYLDSPQYGERMAVYWLDLVRFADTVGYHGDQDHRIAPYRDYVIHAFMTNMPFDQFTIEQLAGDLLEEPTTDQLIATGYNRLLQTSHEGGVQQREYLAKYAADRVRNLGSVWLGVTTGCCECHDHKYDPYTQHDFYSLEAFFADIDEMRTFRGGDTVPTKREPEMDVQSPLTRYRMRQIEARLTEVESTLTSLTEAATSDPAQIASLQEEQAALTRELEKLGSFVLRTMITQSVEPRTIRVLPRGNWLDDTGEIVEPNTPESLPPIDVGERRRTRLDLARWLVSPEQPQTPRVFVNRLWYLFFGQGISRSLDDSGNQGDWPSHPQLLDWMAVEFQQSWDVRDMVETIVLSRTYRQSSLKTELKEGRDPLNRWFSHQNSWRLPAEFVRDNALAVSGLLVDQLGGNESRPYQPAGYYSELNFPARVYVSDRDRQQYRRGVYMHWQRMFLHPMLRAFDAPTREECTARRPQSNTPAAALVLLNDPTFVEAARCLAARVMQEGGDDDASRLRWLWSEVLSRSPDEFEVGVMASLLAHTRQQVSTDPESAIAILSVGLAPTPDGVDSHELAAWTSVCRAVLNLGEGITRP